MKNEITNKANETKIYFDMDGVLARFDKAENAIERFASEKGFFKSLEMTEFAKKIRNIKNTERFYILSASPNQIADNDKMEWIKENLPNIKIENVIFVRSGKAKAEYANEKAVLFDDFTENLEEFKNRNGRVIKVINKHSGIKRDYSNWQKVVSY